MPRPGDPSHGFIAETGRCWRMAYNRNRNQAIHCNERPAWTGRWRSPRGDRWWVVWACPNHMDGPTGWQPESLSPIA